MAIFSPSSSSRSNPCRTRISSPVSTNDLYRARTSSSLLIADDLYRVQFGGVTRRIDAGEQADEKGCQGHQDKVAEIDPHGNSGDEKNVLGQFDELVALDQEADGVPEEHAEERPHRADHASLDEEYSPDAAARRPHRLEDRDVFFLLHHHHDQRRYDIEGADQHHEQQYQEVDRLLQSQGGKEVGPEPGPVLGKIGEAQLPLDSAGDLLGPVNVLNPDLDAAHRVADLEEALRVGE